MNEINWNEMIGFLNDVDDMVEEFTKLFLDIARVNRDQYSLSVHCGRYVLNKRKD
jgi:hypothetical protein